MKQTYRPRRLLPMPEVEARVGLKESQIRQKIEEGIFPRPVRPSPSGRAIRFVEDEIDEYIESRIRERDENLYVPSPAEQRRIEAAAEGRRRARERQDPPAVAAEGQRWARERKDPPAAEEHRRKRNREPNEKRPAAAERS